jgi:hypothetical protein
MWVGNRLWESNEQTHIPFETLVLPLMNDAYNLARQGGGVFYLIGLRVQWH